MTTREQLVEWAVDAPGDRWRVLTTKIAWLHRNGDITPEDIPEVLSGVVEFVVDPEAWRQLRNDVKRLRHAKYRREYRAKLEAARQRRRDYMRVYMTRRRKTT